MRMHMKNRNPKALKSLLMVSILIQGLHAVLTAQSFQGPLRYNPHNPRYFTDKSGRSIYLAGSHTWENFQDMITASDRPFSYAEYLDMMQKHHHNFMRLWVWEQARMAPWSDETIIVTPLPFARTGPGLALDGKPKFDLTKYDPEYFARLRERVVDAGKRNIYVSLMLFQGWSLDRIDSKVGNPFPFQPYNIANNINNIGAPETVEDYDNKPSLHSMMIPAKLLAIQESYVKKVIETVNDLDHILYEIINEGGSTAWQYHMVDFIRKTERTMPKQHPVGMTHRGDRKVLNEVLFNSNADWISPNAGNYEWTLGDSVVSTSFKSDPPENEGKKVIINDTDHLWGHGGNYQWVWMSFLRGLNPIFMDPWEPLPGKKIQEKAADWLVSQEGISKDTRDYPDWDLIRKNIGYTLAFAQRINLNKMVPRSELSTTNYCLADEGHEYLIYFPQPVHATIDLRGEEVEYTIEWFIPLLDKTIIAPRSIMGGRSITLEPPTSALDAVLYLKKSKN